MNDHEILILEGVISYSFFAIVASYSKVIKKATGYIAFILIFIGILILWCGILNFRFTLLMVPLVFLILFQPLRYLFIYLLEKDPIIYIRGVFLSEEEKAALSFSDVVFTFIMIFIPFFSPFFCQFN